MAKREANRLEEMRVEGGVGYRCWRDHVADQLSPPLLLQARCRERAEADLAPGRVVHSELLKRRLGGDGPAKVGICARPARPVRASR